MIAGSAFAALFGNKGLAAWESAALEAAKTGELTPWPWVDLVLEADGHQAVIPVQTDVVSIGPVEDHLRLPLLPSTAQGIANMSGALLPTPWLVYQMWRAAPLKIEPAPIGVAMRGQINQGPSMSQYLVHSQYVDRQIADMRANVSAASGVGAQGPELVAGIKKHVVVSNLYQPNKVLIFGWYRPPPAPDVFDDGRPMQTLDRQPIQPRSNQHGAFYVDYSHGIQLVGGTCTVDGQPWSTADLYRHPTLSKFVSNEGPVRVPRYPSTVPVRQAMGSLERSMLAGIHYADAFEQANAYARAAKGLPTIVPTTPGRANIALLDLARRRGRMT